MMTLPPNFVLRNDPIYPVEVIERFWSKVDIQGVDDCWEWKASLTTQGYGKFKLSGRAINANRLAWETFNNQSLQDRFCLHRCDNPPCCNPNHLFPGTHDENMKDMVQKERSKSPLKSASQKGIENLASKLQENDIRQIRMMFALGVPNTQIGMYMNIHHSMIANIRNGKSWGHI